MEKKINLTVDKTENELRVDIFIKKREDIISRTRIKNLILDNKLRINNKVITDPSKKVFLSDEIKLTIPEPKKASLKPYEFSLDIVYEDKDLIVINKPSGIVMHPGPVNRGIEISSEVADGERSVILQQVSNGIAVRMAILSLSMQPQRDK